MGKGTPEQKSWIDGELPNVLDTAINDYKVWSEKHLLAFEKRHAIKETLYHYTDASGLKGIIDNQEIWFTDYRYLNDPSELTHGMNLAKALIAKGAKGDTASGFFYRMLGDLFSLTKFFEYSGILHRKFQSRQGRVGPMASLRRQRSRLRNRFLAKTFCAERPDRCRPDQEHVCRSDLTRRHAVRAPIG